MRWRFWLIEGPAAIADRAGHAYLVGLAALTIVCLVTVALAALLALLP